MRVLLVAMLATLPVFGQAYYGNWAVDRSEDGDYFAVTVNDSNRTLMQTCTEDGCAWALILPKACKEDAKYAVMAATDAPDDNVVVTELVCLSGKPHKDGFGYALLDFDRIDALIRNPKAKRVGFTYALSDGDFMVVHFNVDGAAEAVQAMQGQAGAAKKLNTRDRIL